MEKDHSFLQGILFITFLYPLICGIIALFNQCMDYFCTKIAAKTAKIVEEVESTSSQEPISAIGFRYRETDGEYDID